tara:strand:+ start:8851 stop:9336 length:486 start_codon:yes stop_codon:yes gene_type:complete
MAHIIPTRPNGTLRTQRTKGFELAINALLSKRTYVLEDAKAARAALEAVEADLAALDHTLGVLGFTEDPAKYMPTRKNRRVFKKGEMVRSALAVLREASGPLSSREICLALLEAKGIDTSDKRLVNQVTSRVYKALQREAGAGRVTAKQHSGRSLVWSRPA